MNVGRSYAILANDLSEVFGSTAIYVPMIAVPTFFAIMLPLLTFYVSTYNLGGDCKPHNRSGRTDVKLRP